MQNQLTELAKDMAQYAPIEMADPFERLMLIDRDFAAFRKRAADIVSAKARLSAAGLPVAGPASVPAVSLDLSAMR